MRSFLMVLVVAGMSAPIARAEDKPVSTAEIDKRARESAAAIVRYGAELFNGGDQAGCYRLYEGAIWWLRSMLEHHPEVLKAIDAAIAKASGERGAGDKAFALREGLDT